MPEPRAPETAPEPADASVPFWAKCRNDGCGHCWPAAYYPLEVADFARIVRKASCPRCGAKRPLVAKQDNGALREPGFSAEGART